MVDRGAQALGKDLSVTPLAHVLISALKLKATGELAIRHQRGEDRVYFKGGIPAGTKVMHSFVPLGRFLLDLGWISQAQMEAALGSADEASAGGPRPRQGDLLVQGGALTPAQLAEGLRLHQQRNLVEVARLTAGELRFAADAPPPSWVADDTLNALRLLRAVLEVAESAAVCQKLFDKMGEDALAVIPPHVLPSLAAFQFDDAERQAVKLLESPITIKQYLARVRVPEAKARAVAAELIVTNLLVPPSQAVPAGEKLAPKLDDRDRDRRRRLLGRAMANVSGGIYGRARPTGATPVATPSVGFASSAAPAPSPSSDIDLPPLDGLDLPPFEAGPARPTPPSGPPTSGDQALRNLIVEKARLLPTLDRYSQLGVTPAATKDQIKAAFVQAARIFHPDHLPPALADLAGAQREIFSAVKEAYDLLLDDGRAREYRASLQADKARATAAAAGPAGTVNQRAREEEARQAAERGEQALRKRDWPTAAESYHQANELAPRGDYLASEAYALFSDPARKKDQKQAREILQEAVGRYPDSEKVAQYSGVLARTDGHIDDAEVWFKKAVALNPKNIDAANELKLIQMRRRAKAR